MRVDVNSRLLLVEGMSLEASEAWQNMQTPGQYFPAHPPYLPEPRGGTLIFLSRSLLFGQSAFLLLLFFLSVHKYGRDLQMMYFFFFSLNVYQEPGTLVGALLKAVERNGAFQARSILSLFFSLWSQGAR